MALYARLLGYLKPFWRHMTLVMLLTFVYVLANYTSYWLSASFVSHLFNEGKISSVRQAGEQEADPPDATPDGSPSVLPKQSLQLESRINKLLHAFVDSGSRRRTLRNICLVIFLAFLMKNLSAYFRRVLIYFIQLRIVVRLRAQLHRVLLRLPLSFLQKQHTGKLTSVVFNDVTAVQTALKDNFVKLINDPLQILANVVLLWIISPRLTVLSFLILPLCGYLIYSIGQSIRRRSRRVFKQVSALLTAFQESVSSIRIVKAFTAEENETRRFEEANRDYFLKEFRAKRLSFVTGPLNETIGVGIFVVLLWYGGNQVYAGTGLSAEQFLRFLVLLFALFQPIRDLSDLNNVIQTGLAAAERIFLLMDTAPEPYSPPGAADLPPFRDRIVFEGVHFSYEAGVPVLEGIDLTIGKGEMVALVGHSGAGKSTLADLIPRFYEVDRGVIRIDGVDIRGVRLQSLRDQIGMVTQETILFNDTIRMNVGYGAASCSDSGIISALKSANAWEFVKRMEHGLDTVIGERGVNLSGGQRQRLSIARAILKNTPLLILDEATSALDTQSEKLVQKAIENLMKNRTVLAIAHRLSTVIHADQIVVMAGGRIVATGRHEALLASCPEYRDIYRMQFENDDSRKAGT
ncbi:MAG TPA: ABC transporter ATP-binding protein [bacterium]|nr:ABC transporter ATP-binding protein [bacterium]